MGEWNNRSRKGQRTRPCDNNSNLQLLFFRPPSQLRVEGGGIDRGIYCIYSATYSAMGG